jgi:hypothetical protein
VGDAARRFPSGDAVALARGIDEVLADRALAADLVERGRVRAEAFPVAACAARVAEVLRRARGAA